MKRFTSIALFAIATLASAGPALAWEPGAQANIPFDFTVGEKVLPSGTYIVSPVSSGVLRVQSRDGQNRTLIPTILDGRESKNGNKLVFHKYGHKYFLSEILCRGYGMNVSIPRSKLEKRVQEQEALLQTDNNVLVALK